LVRDRRNSLAGRPIHRSGGGGSYFELWMRVNQAQTGTQTARFPTFSAAPTHVAADGAPRNRQRICDRAVDDDDKVRLVPVLICSRATSHVLRRRGN
jgi:hypothetical protein